MKLIFLFLAFLTSSAQALNLKSGLILRAIGNEPASEYSVTIEINTQTAISEAALSQELYSDHRNSYCSSLLRFPIGSFTVILKNLDTDWQTRVNVPLEALLGFQTESLSCQLIPGLFVGRQAATIYMIVPQSIVLPIAAPQGYRRIELWLSPSISGITTQLEISERPSDGIYHIKPTDVFENSNLQTLLKSGMSMWFSLNAASEEDSISLQHGQTPPFQ